MRADGRQGVVEAQKIHKIGMMSSDTGRIFFDDVRVPQRYRIGEEGMGFTYQMLQFQEERLWAAASAVREPDAHCIAGHDRLRRERQASARPCSTTSACTSGSPS